MPPPQAIPDQLRAEVERRIMTEKQPHSEVLEWLANEGYPCSTPTLKRQSIRRPNVRTRAALFKKEQEPVKEEPVDEDATDDADDDDTGDLPGLEELLRSAGKKM
jgi:hypothetical protein